MAEYKLTDGAIYTIVKEMKRGIGDFIENSTPALLHGNINPHRLSAKQLLKCWGKMKESKSVPKEHPIAPIDAQAKVLEELVEQLPRPGDIVIYV